jgi:hypothetical protein
MDREGSFHLAYRLGQPGLFAPRHRPAWRLPPLPRRDLSLQQILAISSLPCGQLIGQPKGFPLPSRQHFPAGSDYSAACFN